MKKLVIIVIVGSCLVFAEVKILDKIELHMKKSGSTICKPQYKGYIVADTILIFVLLAMYLYRVN